MHPLFQIKDGDLAARIAEFKTNHGKIETPTILPVINPNKMLVKPEEMKKFGAQAIITNSYIFWKDHQEEVLEKGVHNFLDFNGPIMTDSGAFQLMEYGSVEVSNEQIIDFQKRMGVDIGVILDTPTKQSSHEAMAKCVDETIKRAKESQPLIKDDNNTLWAGPIQGNIHTDLLKKSAKEMSKLDFQLHPIGSVVPLLRQYRFAECIDIIGTVKKIIPADRPVHFFGAGHPMFFAFAVAMGVDLFDSAAYALYAKEKRYLTQYGTEQFEELQYLPCSCPICTKYEINEFNEAKLAQHNLYVTFEELRTIKQAIKEKTLWELLEQRAHQHPTLYKAMQAFVKQKNLINKYDPITKSHFFYLSDFSKKRSEFPRVAARLKKVKGKTQEVKPFGKVPIKISECYPFAQTEIGEEQKLKKGNDDIEKIQDVSRYWFGVNIFDDDVKIRRSRKTGKIRQAVKDGKLLATFRASDFMILLHHGAKDLYTKTDKFRVVMRNDVAEFISKGKTAFAPHVVDADKEIVRGQQVILVDEEGALLGAGEALLNKKEMLDFDHGAAVDVRWGIEK